MKKNIGKTDRLIRLAVGAVLVILAAVIPFWWLLIPAAIALATAAVERCPLYLPFHIRTNKGKN